MSKTEELKEEVKIEEPKDRKAILLDYLREPLPQEEISGVIVRAFDNDSYHRFKSLRQAKLSAMNTSNLTEEEKVAAFNSAEDAALLSEGVIEPKISFKEWELLLKTADRNKTQVIISAIRRLSGIDPLEVELAKEIRKQSIQQPT